MTKVAPQIVHESEAQRQYVRLKLPSMVAMEGHTYTVRDLSTGGLAIRGIEKPLKKGERLSFTLQLPFERFSLDVALTAEVQHYDKKLQTAGCRFVNLDAAQISILNHIVRSYIGGDIVESAEILHVVARNGFVTMRRADEPPARSGTDKIRQYATYAFITLLAVSAAWFVLSRTAQQIFTLTTPHGVIAGDRFDIAAPAAGIFESALPAGSASVTKGATLGFLKPAMAPAGMDISVKSPCDCFITKQHIAPGQYAGEGTVLFTLVPQAGSTRVEALIPQESAHKIRLERFARVTIAGSGETIDGTVTDIRTSDAFIPGAPGSAPLPTAIVIITPDNPIRPDLIGRPAFIDIGL